MRKTIRSASWWSTALPILVTAMMCAGLPWGDSPASAKAAAKEKPAEGTPTYWEFGVFGGNTFYGNELRIANAPQFGLRAGWHFRPPFELEFEFTQANDSKIENQDSTLIGGIVPFLAEPNRKITAKTYSVRFVINPRNERRRLKPYVFIGAGYLKFTASPELVKQDQGGDNTNNVLTVGAGVRHRLTGHMAFRAEFENDYAYPHVFNDMHMTVGLSWSFGGTVAADTDGDGVIDIKDRCPDTPKGALVDKHDGCPWDLDGDGVMEGLDLCPNTPKGWPVDEKGCPLDTDGDGVPDGVDKCADTPKGAIVSPDGCPVDSDADGVPDGLDRCPGTPKGATIDPATGCPHDSDNDQVFDGIDQCPLTPVGAWVDEKGCPKDSDGDRVLDGLDQCPDSPRGQKVDKEGCPRVRIDKTDPQILQNVKFHESGLYPGAEAWLALLVDAANYWSDVTFEIGVYTDSKGSKVQAQRHAEVVKAWLVGHGIDAKRVVTKAYGPTGFIDDNSTDEGKEKNRRVEVKRVSGDTRKHPKPEPEPPAEATKPPEPTKPAEPKPAEPAAPPSGEQAAPPPAQEPPPPPPVQEPAPAPAPKPAEPQPEDSKPGG